MSERRSSYRHVPVVETTRDVYERTGAAGEHAKRHRQELLEQHIQDARRDFTLRNFLLVLLDQHIIIDAEWTVQSSKRQGTHQETIDAVRRVLEALDNGDQPSLPPVLQGKIDLSSLRKEKSEWEAQIATDNKILVSRGCKPNVVANWNDLALDLVCRLPFYEQFQALREVLTAIARGKTPKLPPTLEGISWWAEEHGVAVQKHLDIPYLRRYWRWFKRNFIDPNKVLAKRKPEANCKEPARQILLEKWPRETEPAPPTVPWDRVVDKLVGACSEKEMDAAFIAEWVAREGEYAESDPRAAVLFQLDLAGVQYKLLAEFSRLFPTEAKEWFDAIQSGGAAPRLAVAMPGSDACPHAAKCPKADAFTTYIEGLSAPVMRKMLIKLWANGRHPRLSRKDVRNSLSACVEKSWQSRITRINARLHKDGWPLSVTEPGELIYLDGNL